MGWVLVRGAQRDPKYFELLITQFFGADMFGLSEQNDPIPTHNMKFKAKYIFGGGSLK